LNSSAGSKKNEQDKNKTTDLNITEYWKYNKGGKLH